MPRIRRGATFGTGVPHALFEFRSGSGFPFAPYCVTADGQRFLLNTLVDESGGAPLTVVVNWQAGLSDSVWSSSFSLFHSKTDNLKVELQTERKLKVELGQFHGRSSFAWNGEDGRRGRKVWCNCFERRIRSERHFWASLNYVHHNPAHHGCVTCWQDWPWSSAGEFLWHVGRDQAIEIWKKYPLLDYGKKWDL